MAALVSAALLSGSVPFAPVSPAPVSADGGAQACVMDDVLTRYRAPGDWYRTVLDTQLTLSKAYVPDSLVPTSWAGVSGGGYVRHLAIADLRAMYRASRVAGVPFAIESAYRSYTTQIYVFRSWVRKVGWDRAILASARGGHSEHQLGTTIDIKTPGGEKPWYVRGWGYTPLATWVAANSWKYGWIVSFPAERSPRWSCYQREPWHLRYVGRTIAEQVHRSGVTLREWLWSKGGTTTWTGGVPFPTPAPAPSPAP